MTVYRGSPIGVDPASSGHLPAVRRRRTALRVLLALLVLALLANLLLVEAYANSGFAPDHAGPGETAGRDRPGRGP